MAKLTSGLSSYDGLKLDIKAYTVSDVNAFAMGDGTVRVYAGLMDKFTDDEVRCVVGHEIGHVKLQHGQKRLKRALQQDAALSVAGTASADVRRISSSELGGLIQNVLSAQHSQAAETASDGYALTFMAAKGYPATGMPGGHGQTGSPWRRRRHRAAEDPPRSGQASQADARADHVSRISA